MQLATQEFIKIAEKAGSICTWDTESTGLKADYNSILCLSIKPWHGDVKTFVCERPGRDRLLVKAVRDELSKYAVWITFYGRGFDVPLYRSRLLYHRLKDIPKALHADMYFHLRAHLLPARRSQAHLNRWLNIPEKKMSVAPSLWNDVIAEGAYLEPGNHLAMNKMIQRCESDCKGLEGLWDRTKHLIVNLAK